MVAPAAVVFALAAIPFSDATPMAITTHVDGVTYCWEAEGSVYSSDLGDSTRVNEAQATECALTMSLVLDKSSYLVNEAFGAKWTATLRQDTNGGLVENKFGIAELYAALDRISQRTVEIMTSRIESCAATAANCDPVIGATDLAQNVVNQPTNFTNGTASFDTERLTFATAGDVRIIAHLILPGQDAESKRYDFAMYRTVTISERPTLTPTTNSPSESQSQDTPGVTEKKGLSTEVICIIFVGGMVAVVLAGLGFTMLRKEKQALPATMRKGPDNRTRNEATSTDVDDEFAMLSNDERLMQSLRVPGRATTGFLSTSAPANEPSMMAESRAKAVAKMDVSEQRSRHHGKQDVDLSRDDHIVDTSTPASMRHDGMYMEMKAPASVPMHSKLPASTIYFNDIQEDEILDDGSRIRNGGRGGGGFAMNSVVDPFVDAQSPRGDISRVANRLRRMPMDLDEQRPGGAWREPSEMRFDDLRPSAEIGPGLTLEDLLESQRIQRKKSEELEV